MLDTVMITSIFAASIMLLARMRYSQYKAILFALINIIAVYFIFFHNLSIQNIHSFWLNISLFSGYLLLVSVMYGLTRIAHIHWQRRYWIAIWFPIIFMIFIKTIPYIIVFYMPWLPGTVASLLPDKFTAGLGINAAKPQVLVETDLIFMLPILNLVFYGISYMAFRLSYIVVEIRNGSTRMPSLSEYLGFAFFLPTFSLGPINTFRNHLDSFESSHQTTIPVKNALFRIFIGIIKLRFLAILAQQLTFTAMWTNASPQLDGVDFLLSCLAYYAYIYLNFSGFCDVAIGIAGLAGIRVAENFQHPIKARNIKDFWNRWHITLSQYMRDMVFTPLSKYLTTRFGIQYINHLIAFSTIIVFILIGIWHGLGWNYLFFGLYHAAGMVIYHYYNIWLRKHLGKKLLAYNRHKGIRLFMTALTILFVSGGFFFFENNLANIIRMFSLLQQ